MIHGPDISRYDLNLLQVFRAVATHRSITRAAQELSMSQPAVSHALNRLRGILHDPLFVRGRGAMQLTPFGETLVEPVRSAVDAALGIFSTTPFSPETSERSFTIGVTDYALFTIIPALVSRLRAVAGGVRLKLVMLDAEAPAKLETGEMDCGFWGITPPGPKLHVRTLAMERFVGVICSAHPLADKARAGAVRLEDYLAYPHSGVHFMNVGPGPVDQALADLGYERKVIVSAPSFANNLACLSGTDIIASAPLKLTNITPFFNLVTFELPFPMPEYPYLLIWHERTHADPASQWLRDIIASVAVLP
ncbi:LysR family transcriptional regulator [Asticcacaulis sp. 201]|uniref:LysR family transcriptional regulator n=1 Tax=Asticcacaulis sp. 201 TaxID=3028787 RepID=UPI002916869E|nr:LysR family transcriptional regulator [Asticcacaulis sp. 201]MDV6329535.1 LysR family transcriptional regulator [Asticcacaulis sp. 201]